MANSFKINFSKSNIRKLFYNFSAVDYSNINYEVLEDHLSNVSSKLDSSETNSPSDLNKNDLELPFELRKAITILKLLEKSNRYSERDILKLKKRIEKIKKRLL